MVARNLMQVAVVPVETEAHLSSLIRANLNLPDG